MLISVADARRLKALLRAFEQPSRDESGGPHAKPPRGERVIARVVFSGNRGPGRYAGTLMGWLDDTVGSSTSFDASEHTEALGIDITIDNLAESLLGTNRVGAGIPYFAWPTGQQDDAGRPVYETVYQHSIRYMRYNQATFWLEVSYFDAATVDQVPSDSWVQIVQFAGCDSGGNAVASAVSVQFLFDDALAAAVQNVVAAGTANSTPQISLEYAEAALELLDDIRSALVNPQ